MMLGKPSDWVCRLLEAKKPSKRHLYTNFERDSGTTISDGESSSVQASSKAHVRTAVQVAWFWLIVHA